MATPGQQDALLVQKKFCEDSWGFLSGSLRDTEYALLKRVSGIVGTAVAVYVTLLAGVKTAGVVLDLCVRFSFGVTLPWRD